MTDMKETILALAFIFTIGGMLIATWAALAILMELCLNMFGFLGGFLAFGLVLFSFCGLVGLLVTVFWRD